MTETGTNVRADLRKTAADLQAHAKDRLSEFLAAAEKVAADLTTRTAGSLDGMAGSVKDSMKAVQQATDRGLAELQREQADLFGKQLADQREHFEHLASQQRDLFADVSGGFRKLLDDSIEQTQAVHTSEAAKLGEQLTQQRAYFDQQLKRQDDRFEQVSDRVRALLDESITRSQSLQQQLAENLIARMEQEAERRSKATIDLFAEAARGLDRQIEAKVVASESQLKDISSAAQAAIGARVDGCRQEAAAATARANAACGDLAALRTAMKTQFWVLAGVGLVVLATLALAVLHGNR
jgi:gas vesicle protein